MTLGDRALLGLGPSNRYPEAPAAAGGRLLPRLTIVRARPGHDVRLDRAGKSVATAAVGADHGRMGVQTASTDAERPDLTAWRRRHALRQSSVARPIPSKKRYRRERKHRKRDGGE